MKVPSVNVAARDARTQTIFPIAEGIVKIRMNVKPDVISQQNIEKFGKMIRTEKLYVWHVVLKLNISELNIFLN